METRTQKSLDVLIAKVEAHHPKDIAGAKALAKEITNCYDLIERKLRKADTEFRLLQSRIARDMHDDPDKEDDLYRELAESKQQADILHYQELQTAFKAFIHNRLEKAKQEKMKRDSANTKYSKKLTNHDNDDDF